MHLFINLNAIEEHTKLMLIYTITCARCHIAQYMSRQIAGSPLVPTFQQTLFLVRNRLYQAHFHVFYTMIIVLL